MKNNTTFRAAIALCAILMVGCGSTGEESTKTTEVVVEAPNVKVVEVLAQDVAQIAEFTGSVEPYVMNNISPSMGLRIDDILVEVGDNVRAGQLLVQMDARQYLQTQIQLTNLETDFNRMEELYEAGGISKQQLDQLETQLKVARHASNDLKENTELISPISGVVTERMYDPGDIYSPAAGKILTVMQINRLKVMASIPERYYPQVKNGMAVDITSDIYPDQVFSGKVSLVYPAIDAATRTFKIEVTVANGGLELRPGMMCRVIIGFGTQQHVLVPDISVLKQQGSAERYLFVVDPATNLASRRTVEIGRIIGSSYEILSGVESGEFVVNAGMQKILEGDKVKIVE